MGILTSQQSVICCLILFFFPNNILKYKLVYRKGKCYTIPPSTQIPPALFGRRVASQQKGSRTAEAMPKW